MFSIKLFSWLGLCRSFFLLLTTWQVPQKIKPFFVAQNRNIRVNPTKNILRQDFLYILLQLCTAKKLHVFHSVQQRAARKQQSSSFSLMGLLFLKSHPCVNCYWTSWFWRSTYRPTLHNAPNEASKAGCYEFVKSTTFYKSCSSW